MTNNTACLINVDAFEAAGVPIPSQDPEQTWTWQEFEAACKAITEKAGMKGFLLSSTAAGWDAWLFHGWLGTAGGTFLSPEGDPLFNGAEGVEAMTFLQGLVKNGYTAPLDKGWELALWYSKKAAITINGPWNFPDLQKFTDFKFTVVPFPRNKKPATNIGGNNLFVYNIHPESVEGALNYAEYMLSTDFQVKFNLQSGNLPVTKSATERQHACAHDARFRERQHGHAQDFRTCSAKCECCLVVTARHLSENFARKSADRKSTRVNSSH